MTKTAPLTVKECSTLLAFTSNRYEPAPMIDGRRRTPQCLELVKRGVLVEQPATPAARRYKLTALGIALHEELERTALAMRQVIVDRAKERAA